MIEGFLSGHWYRWTAEGEMPMGWNAGGMSFMMDGHPHQCNVGIGANASFYDSPIDSHRWAWNELENFEEVSILEECSPVTLFVNNRRDGQEILRIDNVVSFSFLPSNDPTSMIIEYITDMNRDSIRVDCTSCQVGFFFIEE